MPFAGASGFTDAFSAVAAIPWRSGKDSPAAVSESRGTAQLAFGADRKTNKPERNTVERSGGTAVSSESKPERKQYLSFVS